MVMTLEAHRDRHRWLHRAMDELLQDYLRHHPADTDTVTEMSVLQLLEWATGETEHPTEPAGEGHRDGILIYAWVDDETRYPIPASMLVGDAAVSAAYPAYVPLAATTQAQAEAITDHIEMLARTKERTMRLVRCVEVETLIAVRD